MKYVIRATHKDGRRFCLELDAATVSYAITAFIEWLNDTQGLSSSQLTTIDIDRMDDEPASTTP